MRMPALACTCSLASMQCRLCRGKRSQSMELQCLQHPLMYMYVQSCAAGCRGSPG